MTLPLVLTAVATLLVFIALVEAAALRLALPQSVMLAALGILLGLVATFGHELPALSPLAGLFAELPLSSETLTLLLLPPLLFDAALRIDAKRMMDDAAPIFLLAVVAVLISTFAVGLALAPFFGVPLLVCLLLGAIVSTTDPLAVLSIFRDVGAPARLVRIVEGESLLNDAAAIALFTVLLLAVVAGETVTLTDGLIIFLLTGLGGLAVGAATGFVASIFMTLTRNHAAALVSVTVALPYIAYIVCEVALGISGAMAVVAAGLVTAGRSQSGRSPRQWRHVREMWEQLSFWASSLVFVLAAFLIPTLLAGISVSTLLASLLMLVAAFSARALVLWGFLPLIQRAALAEHISHRAKTLLLWGGLRGALTLLLALAVTESEGVPQESQEFVAVLATAFVLFTILVNGMTLRPLTKLLGMNRLSPFDRSLGEGARALALGTARDRVRSAARQYGISDAIAERAIASYSDQAPSDGAVPIEQRQRLTLALVVLAQAERTALSRYGENATVSPGVAERLNREAQRMREAARAAGRAGYLLASRNILRFEMPFRAALLAQRWLGWRGPLSAVLAERFERLMVRRLVLRELRPFLSERIAPVLGERVAHLCAQLLTRRERSLNAALEALSLQYPRYATELEQRFLERIALEGEQREYEMLSREGLIGTEISSAVKGELSRANKRLSGALRLDVSVDKRALVKGVDLFADLPEPVLAEIVRALRTRVVVPGERLIRKGERGDTVFFVASGALEVDTGSQKVRLGPGACVGEIAAFVGGGRRSADVTMLGYGELLVLQGRAFRTLIHKDERVRRQVETIVAERQSAARSQLVES